MDEDIVLAFVVVDADGDVSRIEVRDEGVDGARDSAVSRAGPEGYVLAVTAHSLVRLQPEPKLEIEVGSDDEEPREARA